MKSWTTMEAKGKIYDMVLEISNKRIFNISCKKARGIKNFEKNKICKLHTLEIEFENFLSRNVFRKRKEEDSVRTKQTEVTGARKIGRKNADH